MEKLSESPKYAAAICDQHSAYYAAALQRWGEELKGPRQLAALAEIEMDVGNVRVAWDWAIEREHVHELDRAMDGMCRFYEWRGRYEEGEAACGAATDALASTESAEALTVLGENTEEGRQKFIEDLEDTHALFQEFVSARRPQLDMENVATGETWHGQRAVDLKLVDELCTSDEYLVRACETADVFSVRWVEHKKPLERIMARVETGIQNVVDQLFRRPGA